MIKSFFVYIGSCAVFGFLVDVLNLLTKIIFNARSAIYDFQMFDFKFLLLGLLIGGLLFVIEKIISASFLQNALRALTYSIVALYVLVIIPTLLPVFTVEIIGSLVSSFPLIVIFTVTSTIVMEGILQLKKSK